MFSKKNNTLLVIAPHADDEIIGCNGVGEVTVIVGVSICNPVLNSAT